ncbi:hypothetical protein Scep_012869 [Stephania cephalantha]|uniref:Uncharacterized protein n=1 Tax=Stephania cephalantha TaxID=152367 RepID=A0AAP0JFX7_9MAGN
MACNTHKHPPTPLVHPTLILHFRSTRLNFPPLPVVFFLASPPTRLLPRVSPCRSLAARALSLSLTRRSLPVAPSSLALSPCRYRSFHLPVARGASISYDDPGEGHTWRLHLIIESLC